MANYIPLIQQDEKLEVSDSDTTELQHQMWARPSINAGIFENRSSVLRALSWTFQVMLFAASMTLFFWARISGSDTNCIPMTTISAWSPALEAVEYESHTFAGSPYHHSLWKGPPTPELDALWSRVGQVGAMSISGEEVRRLGKDPDYVIKWPEDLGGGHVVSVEVFHHLHCLVSWLSKMSRSMMRKVLSITQ